MTPADLHSPDELEALEAESRPGCGLVLTLGLVLPLVLAGALAVAAVGVYGACLALEACYHFVASLL